VADGIMGMGFPILSWFNATPVFQNLIAADQLDSHIFAMMLSDSGGELILGCLNSDLYAGNVPLGTRHKGF
jgi:hypothetical protein